MSEQPTAPGTTYNLVTLTPGLADVVMRDASPEVIQGELWQFLNTDISTANLTDVDFLNILDMVDIAFCNLINGLPEDRWHEFRIKETIWDTNALGKLVPLTEKIYPITELWDAIRAKVYIKCCKARNGFLMRVLTEQRTFQEYAERGVMRFPGMAPMPGQAQEKKGGWGVL